MLCSRFHENHPSFIGVVREIWTGIRGDSIQNLLADVRFPHKPSKVYSLQTFDTPVNDGENFAQRLKGYFVAPKTGEYKFYSSCDDECEVFLGLDGKEGENNRIISQRRSSMHNEFDRLVLGIIIKKKSFNIDH